MRGVNDLMCDVVLREHTIRIDEFPAGSARSFRLFACGEDGIAVTNRQEDAGLFRREAEVQPRRQPSATAEARLTPVALPAHVSPDPNRLPVEEGFSPVREDEIESPFTTANGSVGRGDRWPREVRSLPLPIPP